MRFLCWNTDGNLCLTKDFTDSEIPARYAILSHTWSVNDNNEVLFADILHGHASTKTTGYAKISFCGEQARNDNIQYFWVDTCCIDRANLTELSEAITSMFRWYQNATKCYVYLSDVSSSSSNADTGDQHLWESGFRKSRWFERGWTLQELLAPSKIDFFSCEGQLVGTKASLVRLIHDATGIPEKALRGEPLSQFPVAERMRWTEKRHTRKKEDRAYSLFGIFDVSLPLIYGEGDRSWSRLKEEIDKRHGTSSVSTCMHWMVPRSANPLFTGRPVLLQDIETTIRDRVNSPGHLAPCQIVISGMGGQGKSEVCLQLARRLRSVFWAVLWIDVSSREIAERSFTQVAQSLSIPVRRWEDARNGIATLAYPWLLILDNADEIEVDYHEYFPDGALGTVIMTTRNDECQRYGTDRKIDLTGLEPREAQELLLKAIGLPSSQYEIHANDASAVAELLQSHPLALTQAGAYISRGHCTLQEYPDLYNRQRRRLLTFRPKQAQSRYRDVYATFEVSAAVLADMDSEASRDALDLLPLLSVGTPNHLPLVVFEAAWQRAKQVPQGLAEDVEDDNVEALTPWHIDHLPGFIDMASDVWDDFRLTDAVALLRAFSLVTSGSIHNTLTISVHPLVHAWARDRQSEGQQRRTWLQMGCVLAFARLSRLLWKDGRWILPHMEALTDLDVISMYLNQSPVLLTRILVNIGWCLYMLRASAKLHGLVNNIFRFLKLDMLQVDASWLGLYDLMGRSANDDDLDKAQIVLEQVIRIRGQTLAEHHSYLLGSQTALAEAYILYGQIQEAVTLLERVVEIRERTLTTDHSHLLGSQYDLAIAYRRNRQVQEAIALLERTIPIQKQNLPEDNPDLLLPQEELVRAYRDNGQVEEAISLLEHVIAMRRQALAENDPKFLDLRQSMATLLWTKSERIEAIKMMQEVVEMMRPTYDMEHKDRKAAEGWLTMMEGEMPTENVQVSYD